MLGCGCCSTAASVAPPSASTAASVPWAAVSALASCCPAILHGLKSAISFYKNALQLAPNDNGFFITKNLIAAYYQNNDLDSIERIVAPKLNVKDIDGVMLGFYSYVLLTKGKDEDAKKLFLKAKEKGLTRKRLSLFVNYKKVLDEFIEKLRPLGSLD